MSVRTRESRTEPIITALAAGAVLYFCFTSRGRATLRRVERWLDEGERETGHLLESAGRVAALVGAVAEAVRLPDRVVVDLRRSHHA